MLCVCVCARVCVREWESILHSSKVGIDSTVWAWGKSTVLSSRSLITNLAGECFQFLTHTQVNSCPYGAAPCHTWNCCHSDKQAGLNETAGFAMWRQVRFLLADTHVTGYIDRTKFCGKSLVMQHIRDIAQYEQFCWNICSLNNCIFVEQAILS